jgi:hypothetical protein
LPFHAADYAISFSFLFDFEYRLIIFDSRLLRRRLISAFTYLLALFHTISKISLHLMIFSARMTPLLILRIFQRYFHHITLITGEYGIVDYQPFSPPASAELNIEAAASRFHFLQYIADIYSHRRCFDIVFSQILRHFLRRRIDIRRYFRRITFLRIGFLRHFITPS